MKFFKKTEGFLHVYFHDIKNKLAGIKFSLELLKNPFVSKEDKTKLIDNMIVTVNQTIDMLFDFLELEKYNKEKFLKNEKTDLKQLTEEILKELTSEIENKHIKVTTIFPDEKTIIKINKKWLKRALFNIIHNAVKYNKKFGEIYIKIEPEKNGVLLTVRDTGIGISELQKKKIFDKFYTSDTKTGSGIGLNMAKTVIESFGGKIAIESEEGLGSKFYIYLPKNSKSVKIKRLAFALSAFAISALFVYDYYFCLFPQKIQKTISGNLIIYKFQNGITATAKKTDKIEITAKRNLFATRFKTKFILKKSDFSIDTNSQPVEVYAGDMKITNMGTDFETIKQQKLTATSVYKGKIKAKNSTVKQGEGLVKKGDKITIEYLPEAVKNIIVTSVKNGNIKISWNSKYQNFKLLISPTVKMNTAPLFEYTTSDKSFTVENIPDGKWYVSIQSEKSKLFSKPVYKSFIFLKQYLMALKAYKKGNIDPAESFVDNSLATIKKASSKPYILKAEILINKKEYKNAINYLKKSETISKKDKTLYLLTLCYYNLKEYKKALNYISQLKNYPEKNRLYGLIYYKLNNFKKAKEYLFKALETNPNDKECIKALIDIFKNENNTFMLHIFEQKLLKGK